MNREIDKQNRPFPEDTVLIRAFQADDKAAFDNLVLRYQDKVFGLCYRFLVSMKRQMTVHRKPL